MWPRAKRAVSLETASQIAEVAKQHHALAAGVFVDEDAGDSFRMLLASFSVTRSELQCKAPHP